MRKTRGLWFIAVAALVVIAAYLAVTILQHKRRLSQRNACVNNMRQLYAGACSYSMEWGLPDTIVVIPEDLIGADNYIKRKPICPSCDFPYATFTIREGPRCPNGHGWLIEPSLTSPWEGSAEEYLVQLKRGPVCVAMSISFHALDQLTPELMDNPEIREACLSLLSHQDDCEKIFAIVALGRVRDTRAVPHLISTLTNKNWRVRMTTAEALGKIGEEQAVEPLKALSEDEQERVRKAAVKALANIGNKNREQ